jgi:hypothetical protein
LLRNKGLKSKVHWIICRKKGRNWADKFYLSKYFGDSEIDNQLFTNRS